VPSLLEEIEGNQELTTYAQWLNQVKPGASPTAIGQYAWSAVALFVEKMKKIGPKPTRKALLAEIPRARPGPATACSRLRSRWAPPDQLHERHPDQERQVRAHRAGGARRSRCKDPIYNTKTKKAEPGFRSSGYRCSRSTSADGGLRCRATRRRC
jgi:hypothetical protein